ncbi:MAG: C40 family peptidase [Muribaculaceae bacterium]|nr:C40 family peptidase [Muribaculaceae bacterium]
MKLTYSIILSFLLLTIPQSFAKTTPSKTVHQEMHTQLLANAKSSMDMSVIKDYLRLEIETKEEVDPVFGTLSQESIDMIGDLLDEAKSHSGLRYRRGGKTPAGFDCSGFTGYVYKQFGYKLNASSSSQYSDGIQVEKGDLRPGDLVFFTSPRSKGGVGHVGIVVEADNEENTFRFIHSAVSGGIQIDKSTAPYYKKRYVGARRIITE